MSESLGLAISRPTSQKRKRNRRKKKTKSECTTQYNIGLGLSLVTHSRDEQSDTIEEEKNNIESGQTSSLEENENLVVHELEDMAVGLGIGLVLPTITNKAVKTDCHQDEDLGWQVAQHSKKKNGVETLPLKLVEGKATSEPNGKVEASCQQVSNIRIVEDQIPDTVQKVQVPAKSDSLNELSDFPPLDGKSPRPVSKDHLESNGKQYGTTTIDRKNPKEVHLASECHGSILDLDKSSVKTVHSDQRPSPPSGDSPKSKKSKKKWSKLDLQNLEFGLRSPKLSEGEVYEAVVVETKRSAFVAVVGHDIRVLVFSSRFKQMGATTPLQHHVPITCVLKVGDHVRLTAIPRTGPSQYKDGEEWVAEECWQERPTSASCGSNEVSHKSTVTEVGTRAVKLADGTFVYADVTFLFGFLLAHNDVDLRGIFQLGDELTYTLPHSLLEHSRPSEADKSWFGSLPANGHDKPSNQQQFELITFLKARSISMSLITAVCGLNKNATGVKDDFHEVYSDIFSTDDQLLSTMHADGVARPNSTKKPFAKVLSKKQIKQAKAKNKNQNETGSPTTWSTASISIIPECTVNSQMVDVATQTHATGDLMCFYTMYCDDSD